LENGKTRPPARCADTVASATIGNCLACDRSSVSWVTPRQKIMVQCGWSAAGHDLSI
jgi:hypothetical protein